MKYPRQHFERSFYLLSIKIQKPVVHHLYYRLIDSAISNICHFYSCRCTQYLNKLVLELLIKVKNDLLCHPFRIKHNRSIPTLTSPKSSLHTSWCYNHDFTNLWIQRHRMCEHRQPSFNCSINRLRRSWCPLRRRSDSDKIRQVVRKQNMPK